MHRLLFLLLRFLVESKLLFHYTRPHSSSTCQSCHCLTTCWLFFHFVLFERLHRSGSPESHQPEWAQPSCHLFDLYVIAGFQTKARDMGADRPRLWALHPSFLWKAYYRVRYQAQARIYDGKLLPSRRPPYSPASCMAVVSSEFLDQSHHRSICILRANRASGKFHLLFLSWGPQSSPGKSKISHWPSTITWARRVCSRSPPAAQTLCLAPASYSSWPVELQLDLTQMTLYVSSLLGIRLARTQFLWPDSPLIFLHIHLRLLHLRV